MKRLFVRLFGQLLGALAGRAGLAARTTRPELAIVWRGDGWSITATHDWLNIRGERSLRLRREHFAPLGKIVRESIASLEADDHYQLAWFHVRGITVRLLTWKEPDGAKLKLSDWQVAPHLSRHQLHDLADWLELAESRTAPRESLVVWQKGKPAAIRLGTQLAELGEHAAAIAAFRAVLCGTRSSCGGIELGSTGDGFVTITYGEQSCRVTSAQLARAVLELGVHG